MEFCYVRIWEERYDVRFDSSYNTVEYVQCYLHALCQRYNSPTNIHDVINPIPTLPTTKKAVRNVSWLDSMLHSVLRTVNYNNKMHDRNTESKVIGVDDTHGGGHTQSYRNAAGSPHVL